MLEVGKKLEVRSKFCTSLHNIQRIIRMCISILSNRNLMEDICYSKSLNLE